MERVLLIDDDELVAGSLREHLVRGGMRVDVAIDCATASHLMNEHAYDVVVIDPYFTGRVLQEDDRVLETIRAQQPSAALIVLTAYASPSMTETAAQVRATAFLAKPQSVVTLGGVVTGACRNATAVFRGSSE
jgi:DNA-binding NtrC family response regulator